MDTDVIYAELMCKDSLELLCKESLHFAVKPLTHILVITLGRVQPTRLHAG